MISFNLEGFRRNKQYLADLVTLISPKILFLQEIWILFHEERLINNYFSDYQFKISTPDMFQPSEELLSKSGPTWHGAAIGWHNGINTNITTIESTHERFTGIRMSVSENSVLLVSFYAPTSGHDEDFFEAISYLTAYILQNMSPGDELVIGTDSNCSEKSTSRRKESWKDFCHLFSLSIHATGAPTFHHNNGTSESKIDFFASSSSLKIADLHQICTLESPQNLSSHDPIVATLNVQNRSENKTD